jgi:hypothetical protein
MSVLYPAPHAFLQEGDVLVPAPGIGGAKGDGKGGEAEVSGVVACGDGTDLVVWSGRIYELRKGRFERAFPFDVPPKWGGFDATLVPTDSGFFTVAGDSCTRCAVGKNRRSSTCRSSRS